MSYSDIFDRYSKALCLQLLHIILSIAWNIAGLLLLQRGLQPLGPTASISTILILLVLGIGLVSSVGKLGGWVYLGVSVILLLGSVSAIYAGFTKPITLWPSEFWRYAGIIVNCIGVLGFFLALKTFVSKKRP